MINDDILMLDAFKDEKNFDKWSDMRFEVIMKTMHLKPDCYSSYMALYGNRIDDYDSVLDNLQKSAYQTVGNYIFSAYRDYVKKDGTGPFGHEKIGHEFFTKCLDILQDKYFELMYAHKECARNRKALEKDSKCGCFYCLEIYNPSEITEWCDEGTDGEVTALCARCGIDAVISESAGYPLTEDFLKSMNDFWFEDSLDIIDVDGNRRFGF